MTTCAIYTFRSGSRICWDRKYCSSARTFDPHSQPSSFHRSDTLPGRSNPDDSFAHIRRCSADTDWPCTSVVTDCIRECRVVSPLNVLPFRSYLLQCAFLLDRHHAVEDPSSRYSFGKLLLRRDRSSLQLESRGFYHPFEIVQSSLSQHHSNKAFALRSR